MGYPPPYLDLRWGTPPPASVNRLKILPSPILRMAGGKNVDFSDDEKYSIREVNSKSVTRKDHSRFPSPTIHNTQKMSPSRIMAELGTFSCHCCPLTVVFLAPFLIYQCVCQCDYSCLTLTLRDAVNVDEDGTRKMKLLSANDLIE